CAREGGATVIPMDVW
nr:immunoglobulin heavy chain junction region [Macaca mulatta]MOW89348.1 immunoglobulin heavy chain junction region [Macaca mulatta]MOW90832.1 immunoglobulin heavy chain junction region [Macaca mulatta]MOW92902.1 immunoglobulin heavy chain junction region [Macaca mulatta]MOW93138.1 immunoglobulin heavy chain junction region [Macaca mulatta]